MHEKHPFSSQQKKFCTLAPKLISCRFLHSSSLPGQFFVTRVTRDRCYDFKNIFAKTFCEKIGIFVQNKAKIYKNLIIALFFEKNAIFCAEN
jgi:hypothetical protein